MSANASFSQTIADRAVTCADIEALSLQEGPVHLIGVDLEDFDLAELDLTGWALEGCVVRRSRFCGAKLEGTRWTACRGAFADFGGADLAEPAFQSGGFKNASFRRSA